MTYRSRGGNGRAPKPSAQQGGVPGSLTRRVVGRINAASRFVIINVKLNAKLLRMRTVCDMVPGRGRLSIAARPGRSSVHARQRKPGRDPENGKKENGTTIHGDVVARHE